MTLEEAVELLNTPKRGRGRAGKTILKELGKDPKTEKPLQLLDGKYGPYVSDGKTNASLPKGTDPEACTLEVAIELLEAKKD